MTKKHSLCIMKHRISCPSPDLLTDGIYRRAILIVNIHPYVLQIQTEVYNVHRSTALPDYNDRGISGSGRQVAACRFAFRIGQMHCLEDCLSMGLVILKTLSNTMASRITRNIL